MTLSWDVCLAHTYMQNVKPQKYTKKRDCCVKKNQSINDFSKCPQTNIYVYIQMTKQSGNDSKAGKDKGIRERQSPCRVETWGSSTKGCCLFSISDQSMLFFSSQEAFRSKYVRNAARLS